MRSTGATSSRGTCRTVNYLPRLQQLRLESDGYPERPVDPCILAYYNLKKNTIYMFLFRIHLYMG